MNWSKLCTALFVWCALSAAVVFGQNITSVVETGGDDEPTDTITAKWTGQTFNRTVDNEPTAGAIGEPFTVPTFGNEAPAFVDRNHRYSNHFETSTPPDFTIPNYLIGGEYIMSGNDNRDNAGYRLDVTVANPSTVYMLIDNRLGGNNADPPTFGPTAMQWILDQGWLATNNGLNRTMNTAVPDEVGIDEGADGGINQWYSLYKKDFAAGTFSLLQPDNAGQNMYGVVIVPSGPPPVPGDTDGDGVVEFSDFEPIRANFRKAVSERTGGDLVDDNVIDFDDFHQWKAAFVGGGGSVAGMDLDFFSVPEPASAALAVVAFVSAGALIRNRRN